MFDFGQLLKGQNYIDSKWDDLPPTVTQNMRVDEQSDSDQSD